MFTYAPFTKQTLYLSSAVHRRRRKPRAVKRSGTECGLRAVAQISVAFANRAGLAGAAKTNPAIRSPKLDARPARLAVIDAPWGVRAGPVPFFRAPVQGSAEVAAARSLKRGEGMTE